MKAFFAKIKKFIVQHKVWSSVIAGVLVLSILAGIFLPTLVPLLTGKCKVTFETNGAGEVETIWVEKGQPVPTENLVNLKKENNTFLGWFADETCEIQYVDAPITQNTTLYAGFFEDPGEEIYELEEIYIGGVDKDFALPITSVDKLTNDNISEYLTLTVNYGAHEDGSQIKLSVSGNGEGKYLVTANYAQPGSYTIHLKSNKIHIDGDDERAKPFHLTAGNRTVQFSVNGKNVENIVVSESVKNVSESVILASNDKAVQFAATADVKVGDIVQLPYLDGTDHFKITGEITKAQAQSNGLTAASADGKFYSITLAEIGEIYDALDVYKEEDIRIDETTTVEDLAQQLADSLQNSQEMNDFTTLLLESSAYTPTVQKLSAQPLGNASSNNVQLTNVMPLSAIPKIEFNVKNPEFAKQYSSMADRNFVKISVSLKRSASIASLADGELQIDATVTLEFYLHMHGEGWTKKDGWDAEWDVGVVTATQTNLSFEVAVSTQDDSPQALITEEIRNVLSYLENTPADKLIAVYNRLVPEGESDRAVLFRHELIDSSLTSIKIGIVEISFPVEIIISVDFRAAISADFTIMTWNKHGVNGDTDDWSFGVYELYQPTTTTYEMYMQGKVDLRAGVEVSVQLNFVGLSRLGNVRASVQVGAYVRIYGMGFVIRDVDKNSWSGGAAYVEGGLYVNFNVSATVLAWSVRADLMDAEIPLFSRGTQSTAYEFVEAEHETIVMNGDGFLLQDIPGLIDVFVFDLTADEFGQRIGRFGAEAYAPREGGYIDSLGYVFDQNKIKITFDNPEFGFTNSTGRVWCRGGTQLQMNATMTIHYLGSNLSVNEPLTKQVKVQFWDDRILGEYDETKVGTTCTLTLTYDGFVFEEREYQYGEHIGSGRAYSMFTNARAPVPDELFYGQGVCELKFSFPDRYILEDMTIEGEAEKFPIRATFTYINENGVETTSPQIVTYHQEVPDVSEYVECCPDYLEFVGWDKPLTEEAFSFLMPFPASQWHYTAQYIARYTALVHFDTDGGILTDALGETVNSKTTTAVWNENNAVGYRLVNAATKEGYNFKGWEYNGKVYTLYDEVPLTPGSEVTLKAVFEKKPVAITFETYNGSLVQYYNVGDGINLPNTEMNDLYLTGWKSQKDGQTYSVYYHVTENDTLTAQYAEEGWHADFDAAGGIFQNGDTYRRVYVPYGEKCNMTDVPVIDKGDGKVYVFSHWTPDMDQPINGHTTFTAVYKEEGKTHTITFDLNGGKMPSNAKLPEGATVSADGSKISFTVTEGAYAPDIENPILVKGDGKDYVFVEWTPAFEPVTADITYKAVYDEVVQVGPGEDVDNPIDPGDVVGVHHKFENGVLTIYGTGKIANYLVDHEGQNVRPWDANYDKITKIVIEDGITYVGNHAFSYLPNLTTVEMADSVTSAGFACFMSCGKLTNVKLSKNLVCNSTTYEQTEGNDCSSMFVECTSLKTITLPEGFTRVPYQMFHSCTSLTTVNLPSKLEIIEDGAFISCTSLKSLTLPASVKTIQSFAFFDCTALESINTNDSMDVAEDAFEGCTNLKR